MTKKRRRTEPADVRKGQIIDAARASFIRTGFASARMADIADAAGVSIGLVYRYFPSKEALVEAIVAEEAQGQAKHLLRLVEGRSTDDRLTLDELIDALRATLTDRDRVLLMLEVATAMIRNEGLRQSTISIQLGQANDFVRRLAPALSSETDPSELNCRLQVVAALTTGVAIQLAVNFDRGADRIMELFNETAKTILRGPGRLAKNAGVSDLRLE